MLDWQRFKYIYERHLFLKPFLAEIGSGIKCFALLKGESFSLDRIFKKMRI
jgi:hypothetical protein